MQSRRIVVAAAIGLPAAAAALVLAETVLGHFAARDHTLHFGDFRFGVAGHLPIGQPRRYVDGCRYCDAERLAEGHWSRNDPHNPEWAQPGHVEPVDGCTYCRDGISTNLATAFAARHEEAEQAPLDAAARSRTRRARAEELVLNWLDASLDGLCDQVERLLWLWFPPTSQPQTGIGV